jgi:hypothetical protein
MRQIEQGPAPGREPDCKAAVQPECIADEQLIHVDIGSVHVGGQWGVGLEIIHSLSVGQLVLEGPRE